MGAGLRKRNDNRGFGHVHTSYVLAARCASRQARFVQHLATTAYRLWSADTAPLRGMARSPFVLEADRKLPDGAERDQLPSPLADFEQAWLELPPKWLIPRSPDSRSCSCAWVVQRCRIFGQPADQRAGSRECSGYADAISSSASTRSGTPLSAKLLTGVAVHELNAKHEQDEREPGEMLHQEVVGRHPLTSARSAAAASDGSCGCRLSRSARWAAEHAVTAVAADRRHLRPQTAMPART